MTTKQKQQERETAVIRAPHDGSEVGVVALAGPEDVRAALDANVAAARACREMPAYTRAAALRKVADGLEAARAEFARTLALEAGKPIAQAKTEIDRAIFVFRDGAEEATRIDGAVLPADVVPAGTGRIAITRRFPLSPIAGITPFNFPVLLAAHKIAPAMACGATITLKPPPQDPLTTLRLGELIKASGLLRLLLLEGDALVHQVNRDYGLKLEFRFHALPKVGQENVLAAWTRVSKSANPNDKREPQRGNLDDFLAAGCLGLRGRILTVRDVIRANAHLKGGVHVGRLREKDVGGAGVLVIDRMLNVGGAEASLAVLRDIIQVTLEAVKPLAEVVRERRAAEPADLT